MITPQRLRRHLSMDRADDFFEEFIDDQVLNLLNSAAPIWFREELKDIVSLLKVGVDDQVFSRREEMVVEWLLTRLTTVLRSLWDLSVQQQLPQHLWFQIHTAHTCFGLSDMRDRDVLLRANTLRLSLLEAEALLQSRGGPPLGQEEGS